MVRIATRASALARWQANHVADLLREAHPGLVIEVVAMTTEGDRRTDVPLSEIGGKGVFATEVQRAVVEARADMAVHSAKDLPAVTPPELMIAALPRRGDPRDALVGCTLEALPAGATVATGSARRRALLADLRPDLRFAELRGNMATRLEAATRFDAIVVAGVALQRLGLDERIDDWLDPRTFIPQVSQAALAVECGVEDNSTQAMLAAIDHAPTRRCVEAERAFLVELGGDCSLPAGAHARIGSDGELCVAGVLADRPGGRLVRGERSSLAESDPGGALAASLRAELEESR